MKNRMQLGMIIIGTMLFSSGLNAQTHVEQRLNRVEIPSTKAMAKKKFEASQGQRVIHRTKFQNLNSQQKFQRLEGQYLEPKKQVK